MERRVEQDCGEVVVVASCRFFSGRLQVDPRMERMGCRRLDACRQAEAEVVK